MQKRYNQVSGHPGLIQDPESGAIINTDPHGKEQRRLMKQRTREMESRMDTLESAVFEIRDVLRTLTRGENV